MCFVNEASFYFGLRLEDAPRYLKGQDRPGTRASAGAFCDHGTTPSADCTGSLSARPALH